MSDRGLCAQRWCEAGAVANVNAVLAPCLEKAGCHLPVKTTPRTLRALRTASPVRMQFSMFSSRRFSSTAQQPTPAPLVRQSQKFAVPVLRPSGCLSSRVWPPSKPVCSTPCGQRETAGCLFWRAHSAAPLSGCIRDDNSVHTSIIFASSCSERR